MNPGTPRRNWRTLASLCLLPPIAITAVAASQAAPGTDRLLPSLTLVKAELQHSYAERTRHRCAPQAPIEARLDFATRPSPGVPTRVVLSALPASPMLQPQVTWILPDAVKAGSPARSAAKPLAAGELGQFATTVTFPRYGEYVVGASILDAQPGKAWGREVRLHVRIDRSGFQASSLPQPSTAASTEPTRTKALPANIQIEASPLRLPKNFELPLPDGRGFVAPGRAVMAAASREPQAQSTITIHGRITYMGRDGNALGAFGSAVQLWDRDYGFLDGDDFLGETLAGPDGSFSFNVENTDDGRAGDRLDPYLIFSTHTGVVKVFKPEFADPVFSARHDLAENIEDGAVGTRLIDGVGPAADLGWDYKDDGDEGAWEMVDYLSRGWVYYRFQLGFPIDRVDVAWKPGYIPTPRAYYEGLYKRITIGDGNHNDIAVVMHEYGHHILQVVKDGQIFWGKEHGFERHADAHLAWFEGWATYSGQRTLGQPVYLDQPGYCDGGSLTWDIEHRTGTPPGETIESSIAGALWDLSDDSAGDTHPHDSVGPNSGGGETQVWDCVFNSGHLNSILDFRGVWLNFGKTANIDAVYRDHHVFEYVKADTSIAAPPKQGPAGQPMEYPIRLTRSTDGEPLANQPLKVSLNNGTPYDFTTGRDGFLYLTVTPGPTTSELRFKAEYAGNDLYNATSTTALLTFGNSVLEFTTPDTELGRTATWTVIFKSNGKPVSGKKLHVYVAGRYVGAKTTNSSGKITHSQPSPKGVMEIPLKVEFRGDTTHGPIVKEQVARWVKAPVNVTIPVMTYTQGKKATLKAYIERATDKKGIATESSSPERTVQVEFYVDGAFKGYGRILGYGSKSSGNTIFDWTIPSTMSVGQHTLEVKFPGSVNYHARSGTGKFTVKAPPKKKGK